MSNFIPKPQDAKLRGLGPKAQKLQALRDKAAAQNDAANASAGAPTSNVKAKAGIRKTAFSRKAT